jgi:multiple sugar transport system substrate-binding protein
MKITSIQLNKVIAVCLLIVLGSPSALAREWSKEFQIKQDIPGDYSFESISKKDYSGVKLNIISHQKPNLGGAVEKHARHFEKLTGARISIDFVKFPELYLKILWGLKQESSDIVFGGRKWLVDFAPFLEPLPVKLLNSPEYKDITHPFDKLGMWNGVHLMVVIDGDRHFLQYRTDITENPPKTWKEFTSMAKTFNKKKSANGSMVYGAAEITEKNNLVYAQFFKRAAAYAKHPQVKGGFYFELKTMKPLINTPGFVAALQDFVDMQQYYPPGGDHFTLVTAANSFASGQVALSDMWEDAFVKAIDYRSPIKNLVGATISPGSKRVWNRITNKWDSFPNINRVHFIPSSWSGGVSKSCQNKTAAFDFLGFFGNIANHRSDILDGKLGVNSFRSTEQNTEFWQKNAGLDKKVATSYVETLKNISQSKQHVHDLNIHQAQRYLRVLSDGIARALTGRSTPQEALDDVAKQWSVLNNKIGIEKQQKAYLNLVKLEDNE